MSGPFDFNADESDPMETSYNRPMRREPAPSINQNVILATGREKPFPHLMHAIVSVLTGGLWVPCWIIHRLLSQR